MTKDWISSKWFPLLSNNGKLFEKNETPTETLNEQSEFSVSGCDSEANCYHSSVPN